MKSTSALVIERLAQAGVTHAFGVTGGAIMHIIEGLHQSKNIETVFTHHEQSAAIAAEAYGKISGRPAIVFATAGPGVTNVVTGLADAYLDSIPLILLAGNVRTDIAADFTKQRNNAPQEVDQKKIISPVVKKYYEVEPAATPEEIIALVDEAFHEAISARPGPVVISLPLNSQATQHKSFNLPAFKSQKLKKTTFDFGEIKTLINNSHRPLFIFGAGIRIANCANEALEMVQALQIPYVVTIGAVDLQNKDDALSIGCIGPTSQRSANLITLEADLLIAIGTSLDASVTGFNTEGFYKNKTLVSVNIDSGDQVNIPKINSLIINQNCRDFILSARREKIDLSIPQKKWLKATQKLKNKINQSVEKSLRTKTKEKTVCAYQLINQLSKNLDNQSVITLGISLDAHATFNAFEVSSDQRIIVSRNLGPMGWDIPASIGAYYSSEKKRQFILITGDGSSMLNLQELSIISGRKIPLCIFLFNNQGYTSIRTTQDNFFSNGYFGCDQESGLHFPNYKKLAEAFSFDYKKIDSSKSVSKVIRNHKEKPRPLLVECILDPKQKREPRLVSTLSNGVMTTPTIADMYPPLPEEKKSNIKEILKNTSR